MIVIAIFKIKSDKIEAFKQAMTRVQEEVISKEPGTVYYRVVQSAKKPERWVVIEEYKDSAAFKTHGKGEAIGQLLKMMPQLGEADVQVYNQNGQAKL